MSLLNSYLMAEEEPKFDPNSVTPGVIGFLATFLVIVAVVLLVRDMVRRIRRIQYRAEVNALLDAEEAALADHDDEQHDGPTDESSGDTPER